MLVALACNHQHRSNERFAEKQTIYLQPIQYDDTVVLRFLKDSIEKFYPVSIEIAGVRSFPANSYYAPRKRYRADSTIAWLRKIKPAGAYTMVGITAHDISTTKSKQQDFGVMGLGYMPGDACVISTWRLKKTATSTQHMRQRLFKVVVHEIGHNFGLGHCPDQTCIMVDAEAKMKLDAVKELCSNCKHKLPF